MKNLMDVSRHPVTWTTPAVSPSLRAFGYRGLAPIPGRLAVLGGFGADVPEFPRSRFVPTTKRQLAGFGDTKLWTPGLVLAGLAVLVIVVSKGADAAEERRGRRDARRRRVAKAVRNAWY
jgi:hypothetical protein